MMDEFEKNIRNQRSEFDTHTADRTKMWAEISKELDASSVKVIPLWRRTSVRIAASVLLILGLTVILGLYFFNTSGMVSQNSIVSEELGEIDMYYGGMVQQQVKLVKFSTKLSGEDKKEFLSFLDELDMEYRKLRKELAKNINNEMIMEAIIANYKKRIELIENLLNQLKEEKHENDAQEYTL